MKTDDYISIVDYKMIFGFRYSKQIILYFVILMMFIISLILIAFNFDYYTYYNGTFLFEKGDEYSFVLNAFDVGKIPDIGFLVIDNQKYSYKIKDVSDITQSEYMYLQKITLKIKINRHVKVFNGRLIISKEKLIWYMVNYLKGGKNETVRKE